MEIYLIQSISELVLEDMPQEGLALHEDCVIRVKNNGVRTVADAISAEIGSINVATIKEPGVGNCLQRESPSAVLEDDARRVLLRAIVLTQQFFLSLWIVKDHSANTGEAHMVVGDRSTGKADVYGQRVPFLLTNAACARTTTTFTKAEVDQAVANFRGLERCIPQQEWYPQAQRQSGLVIKSRLFRALYSAEMARASAEIGVKIAYYCIAFEALFSTSKEAIAHQIAERAAILVETDSAVRLAFYRDLKKVYDIRSTVVHGDVLSTSDLEKLRATATKTDSHLRKTFQVIFASEMLIELFTTKESKVLGDYFLSRVFTGAPPTGDATLTA